MNIGVLHMEMTVGQKDGVIYLVRHRDLTCYVMISAYGQCLEKRVLNLV